MLPRLGEGALVTTRSGDILTRIVRQPFAVSGKRIRPALVLLAARAAGGRPDGEAPMVSLAAAVELLHAASLVHDDVIDGADSRRHQASLNRLFGNPVAVLAGDLLYTSFFSRLLGLSAVSLETRASDPRGLPLDDERDVHGRDPRAGDRLPRQAAVHGGVPGDRHGQDRRSLLRVLPLRGAAQGAPTSAWLRSWPSSGCASGCSSRSPTT